MHNREAMFHRHSRIDRCLPARHALISPVRCRCRHRRHPVIRVNGKVSSISKADPREHRRLVIAAECAATCRRPEKVNPIVPNGVNSADSCAASICNSAA